MFINGESARKIWQPGGRHRCAGVIALWLWLPVNIFPFAMEPQIRFSRLSDRQGLSNNTILSIAQDHEGFIWIATWDGLNCFDGHRFRVFRHDPADPGSFAGSVVKQVYIDPGGEIWVCTNIGLHRFNPRTECFEHFPILQNGKEVSGLRGDQCVLRSGRQPDWLWVGTGRSGVVRFNPATRQWSQLLPDPEALDRQGGNRIVAMTEDRQGCLWVVTEQRLCVLFPGETTFRSYPLPGQLIKPSGEPIQFISEDSHGRLWLGGPAGLYLRDRIHNRYLSPAEALAAPVLKNLTAVGSFVEDRNGHYWFASTLAGLYRFDPRSQTLVHCRHDPSRFDSLSFDNVTALFCDRDGVLWAGTYTRGLNLHDPLQQKFIHFYQQVNDPASLNCNQVKALHVDRQERIWAGTVTGGISRLDLARGRFRAFRHNPRDPRGLCSDNVADITSDAAGRLWIGYYNQGLDCFDPARGVLAHYQAEPGRPGRLGNDWIRALFIDSHQQMWVGTRMGIYRFNPANGAFAVFPPVVNTPNGDELINHFAEDSSERIWIATNGGLRCFSYQTGLFTDYAGRLTRLVKDRPFKICCLHFSRREPGQLWLGTSGYGMIRFDIPHDHWEIFRERDGLPSDVVYQILEAEDGCLWVSTNHGLSRFDPQARIFTNFDTGSGVQGNEFNKGSGCMVPGGYMLFGGQQGLNAFQPSRIQTDRTAPVPTLTEFRLFNRPVRPRQGAFLPVPVRLADAIKLQYEQNVFSFEFTTLHFGKPQAHRYAYKLEGFDSEWRETTADNRMATYTSLPANTYRFRVKVSNTMGIWSDLEKSILVHVIPPYWQTWWFRTLILLLGISVISAFLWLRIRYYRRELAHQTELEQAMTQVSEAERSRIGMELHDTLSHELLDISIEMKLLLRNLPGTMAPETVALEDKFRQAIRHTKTIARGLFPVDLKEKGLPAALEEMAADISARHNVPCRLEMNGDVLIPHWLTSLHLYYVAREAAFNAARHARASAIVMTLAIHDGRLCLTIRDDGQGMAAAPRQGSGMGLKIMEYRVRLLGGEFHIHTNSAGGTTLSCTIPYR